MRRRQGVSTGVLAMALLLGPAPWAQSQQPPVREITKIAGEVYRFRNANHYSVFAEIAQRSSSQSGTSSTATTTPITSQAGRSSPTPRRW
jgi:hypothetical protein